MPLYTHINEWPAGHPPQRILSLVPSQTEWLYSIGLQEEVIGITKFCIHPEKWLRQKTRVGGTKTVDLERVASLQPDLIIANKEENVAEQIRALAENYPVFLTDVNDLDGAMAMMQDLAVITGRETTGGKLLDEISDSFASWQPLPGAKTVVYLIWREPYMSVGDDTYIHGMLEKLGFKNALTGQKRYPEINREQLQTIAPDFVLLSSEPYPFRQKHLDEISEWLPASKVVLVDGEIFSWYGSRMLKAVPYFQNVASHW